VKSLPVVAVVTALVACALSACSDDEQLPTPTIDAAVVDAAPAIDAAIDAAACAGTVVGGACWYRGALGQSCTTVCATHGGASAATVSYAGAVTANDRSNQAHCQAIVAAFAGLAFTAGVDNVTDPNDQGCVDEPDKNRSELISLNPTVVGGSDPMLRRFCACNE